ncbi:MAG: reverse transcriptase/maturase family protein [Patescibacteria group bacterium]
MKRCSIPFEEVASLENLCEAWQEFIRGKRKKIDVQEFAMDLGDELVALHQDLMWGTYVHGPYRHFRINDPKPRDIHKASVRDRLLHHAIHRKLYPFFALTFIADSYSYQKGKGLHRALDRFRTMARKVGQNHSRTCWVLKCDIRKYFASVDHGILSRILADRMIDQRLLRLLVDVVGSFHVTSVKGMPLGNLTSQLFANVYLNELDQFVKRGLGVKHYVRYADDFVLLLNDRPALVVILPKLRSFLSDRLALELHPDKISIATFASGVDFLGWVHFPHHRVPRTKTKRRMSKRIRGNPKDETLQSYLGLLERGDTYYVRSLLMDDYWLYSEMFVRNAASEYRSAKR